MPRESKSQRSRITLPPPHFAFERDALSNGFRRVAGVDEAGRGPLAGPVVAASVILPEGFDLDGVNDSKALSSARREALYGSLADRVPWAVGIASVEEIDRLNILKATHLAMRRALEALQPRPDFALVDGLAVKGLPIPHLPIVKGDCRCLSIAAASIIAKVTRDRLMRDLHACYPAYGFDRHKGYGTPEHLRALEEHGPCPAHRRSFAPVSSFEFRVPSSELSVSSSEFRVPSQPSRNSEPGTRNPRAALGAEGERRAALALQAAGYEVLERNARVSHDELDIICRHGEAWVFVEVKTRRGDGYGAPDEAVTQRKQGKLTRAALAWLEAHGIEDPEWRFDVVTVRLQNGAPPRIEIIVNAF
ncbi:MAG TPA: ribonuclease HII [Armatimonadota bacterium]